MEKSSVLQEVCCIIIESSFKIKGRIHQLISLTIGNFHLRAYVLFQSRVFNETPINPRKCGHILTKVLYLLNQGEHIGTMEATEAFFAMTKLFQSKDVSLSFILFLGGIAHPIEWLCWSVVSSQ